MFNPKLLLIGKNTLLSNLSKMPVRILKIFSFVLKYVKIMKMIKVVSNMEKHMLKFKLVN